MRALINPFIYNVVKWPKILLKSCGVNTARFLKYLWPFYNILHERVKNKTFRSKVRYRIAALKLLGIFQENICGGIQYQCNCRPSVFLLLFIFSLLYITSTGFYWQLNCLFGILFLYSLKFNSQMEHKNIWTICSFRNAKYLH